MSSMSRNFPLLILCLRSFWASLLLSLVAASCSFSSTTLAFSIADLHHAQHAVQHVLTPSVAHQQANAILASRGAMLQHIVPNELWTAYQHQLTVAHPLLTKMLTGGTLAVAGDALAQQRSQSKDPNNNSNNNYDVRRAGSFAVFDMAYRAVQHYTYPVLVQHCQGTVLASVAALALSSSTSIEVQHAAAALEQTLASQWIIVPFLYYPVFFTLTGFLQGLDARESGQRAYDTIGPLLRRNWCFWIPVQFVQFAWIPTDWQIPFLSCAGLFWTFLLSVTAGSARTYATTTTMAAVEDADSQQKEQQALAMALMRAEPEERILTMATTRTLDDNDVSISTIASSQPQHEHLVVGASAVTASVS